MRSGSPVSYHAQYETWHVFRYADVQRVLTEYATFSSAATGGGWPTRGQSGPAGQENRPPIDASLTGTDPPRHRQLRSLVSQAFTPRAIEAPAPGPPGGRLLRGTGRGRRGGPAERPGRRRRAPRFCALS